MAGSQPLRRGFGEGQLRVGDAEREGALSALGKHYAEGRLTADELDERISAALRARTRSDLADLVRDLPGEQPAWYPPRPRHENWRVFGRALGVAAAAAVVIGVLISLLFVVLLATMMAFGGLLWIVLLWWLLTCSVSRSYGCGTQRRRANWRNQRYVTRV
jgi:Domain of unknown function (DUF1707)